MSISRLVCVELCAVLCYYMVRVVGVLCSLLFCYSMHCTPLHLRVRLGLKCETHTITNRTDEFNGVFRSLLLALDARIAET